MNIGRRRVRTRHTQVISVTTLGRAGRIRRRTLCCRIPPGGAIAQRAGLVGVGTTGHDAATGGIIAVTEASRLFVHTEGLALGVWAVDIGRRRIRTRHTQVIGVTTLGRAGRIRRRTLCCRIPPGGAIAQRAGLVGVGTTGHDAATGGIIAVTEARSVLR